MKRGRQGESCRSCEHCKGVLHQLFGAYADCELVGKVYKWGKKVIRVDLCLCCDYKRRKKEVKT